MVQCLVVDDSPTIRLMVASNIRRAKEAHFVIEASDAKSAMAMFKEHRPEVVFLDLMLPEPGSGLRVLREMLEKRPMTHIVLITGLAPEHPDVVEGLSAGAFGYLRKPVRGDAIKGVLHDIEDETGHLRRIG